MPLDRARGAGRGRRPPRRPLPIRLAVVPTTMPAPVLWPSTGGRVRRSRARTA